MKQVKVPRMDIDFSKSKHAGSKIAAAVEAVSTPNHAFGVMKPHNYLRNHKKMVIDCDCDGI